MKLNKNQKRLIQIIIGGGTYIAAVIVKSRGGALPLTLFLAAFIIIGYNILYDAVRNLFCGRPFDENFLMSIASVGAIAIGQYSEGVAVMLFYQIGELFQSYAVNKSRKSIAKLMDIRPDFANLQQGDTLKRVDPDEVQISDIIVIKPGERIPLDAEITDGHSFIDMSALTGESTPREAVPGDAILSGCINVSGMLTARVTKEFGESTVSKILDLVENASTKKSVSENFITKFARYYTPAVVAFAILLAVIPPLVVPGAKFGDWLYRALVFLVISCPCALVISVPLSFFGGIGGASRSGILVKGSNYLEALAATRTAVFDKTGTLTKGVFEVVKAVPSGISEGELLELAAYTESYSNHPISLSLARAYDAFTHNMIDTSRVIGAEEIAGHGVIASLVDKRGDEKKVAAGNGKLMKKIGVKFDETDAGLGTVVHIAADGVYRGYIIIADENKDDAADAIVNLRNAGVEKTVMLTGDAKPIGERIAAELGIDEVYAELLPADKMSRVEELLANQPSGGKLVFVGDGINDAPVLALADIGVAMGGLGSDAAIEAADVVIMTDEPSKLAVAIKIARKTLRIVRQNIFFALSVKAVVLLLGALGYATMWAAVFADVGVTVIAIFNAIRALSIKNNGDAKVARNALGMVRPPDPRSDG